MANGDRPAHERHVDSSTVVPVGEGNSATASLNRYWVGATVISALALFVVPFPKRLTVLLPQHGSDPAHPPVGLWSDFMSLLSQQGFLEGSWSGLIALGLFALVPVLSARLLYRMPGDKSSRRIVLAIVVAANVCYLLYFQLTYHPGILALTLIAIALAAVHMHELKTTLFNIGRMSSKLADVNAQVDILNAKTIEAVYSARGRVLSSLLQESERRVSSRSQCGTRLDDGRHRLVDAAESSAEP